MLWITAFQSMGSPTPHCAPTPRATVRKCPRDSPENDLNRPRRTDPAPEERQWAWPCDVWAAASSHTNSPRSSSCDGPIRFRRSRIKTYASCSIALSRFKFFQTGQQNSSSSPDLQKIMSPGRPNFRHTGNTATHSRSRIRRLQSG